MPEQRKPLKLRAYGQLGQPLTLEAAEIAGLAGGPWQVHSQHNLEPARGSALDRERLIQQFSRLGGTPWRLEELQLDLQGELFLPVAQLNQMRRALVELLAQANRESDSV